MPWFKRTDKGILTPTESKREVPDGLWFKSPAGKIIHTRELKNNAFVVPEEDHHVRFGIKSPALYHIFLYLFLLFLQFF